MHRKKNGRESKAGVEDGALVGRRAAWSRSGARGFVRRVHQSCGFPSQRESRRDAGAIPRPRAGPPPPIARNTKS